MSDHLLWQQHSLEQHLHKQPWTRMFNMGFFCPNLSHAPAETWYRWDIIVWGSKLSGSRYIGYLHTAMIRKLLGYEPGCTVTDHFRQPMHQVARFLGLLCVILTWHV